MLYTKRIILKILFFLLLLIIVISCKTTTKVVEIPVETIKTEYIEQIKYDSIYHKDSIYIMQKGTDHYSFFKDHAVFSATLLYRIFLCASKVQMVSTVYILLLLCSNSLSVSLYVLFCDIIPHFSELFIVLVLTFQLKSSII